MMRPHPGWDWIEWRAIEFLIVAIDNPDCTILTSELRHHHGEFARKLLGSIRGNVQAFQDEAALVFAFLANHEIKRVIRHPKVPPFRFASHDTTESGNSVSATHREQSRLSPHVAFRQKEAIHPLSGSRRFLIDDKRQAISLGTGHHYWHDNFYPWRRN
jgi:hypothetical protein